MSNNNLENNQRINEVAGVLQAGRPGERNMLNETAEAWLSPDEQIHTRPVGSITLGGKVISGDQLSIMLARSQSPVVNLRTDLAVALATQVDPAMVFVATNNGRGIQRYSMLVDGNLHVAEGSPFFDPRESVALIEATRMTPAQLLEERALMLEQAVSAARLREVSLVAQCVGEKALTTEVGHTFAALLAGSVFERRDAMDAHIINLMPGSSGLDAHTPHNTPQDKKDEMRYEAYAVQRGVNRPDIYSARAPLVGTAQIVPLDQATQLGWALGIETSSIKYTGTDPMFYRAHVYGLNSAAPAAAAIYQTLHPDQDRMASVIG